VFESHGDFSSGKFAKIGRGKCLPAQCEPRLNVRAAILSRGFRFGRLLGVEHGRKFRVMAGPQARFSAGRKSPVPPRQVFELHGDFCAKKIRENCRRLGVLRSRMR
jgi:hypothetical protein